MSDRNRSYIAGVGMVPFVKPSQSRPYDELGRDATRAALADAGIEYGDVQQAFVGYALGSTTSGQQSLYQVGTSGIPIVNVNNACASGATALFLARQAVASGAVDVALALGFEQMVAGAIAAAPDGRKPVNEKVDALFGEVQGWDDNVPRAAQYFGGAGREYQALYGAKDETFARVAVKARAHAARNPLAIFRTPVSVDEVLASPRIHGPLTRLQCCPPTCGAAAAVLVSARWRKQHGGPPIAVAGQAMTTDRSSSFDERSLIKGVGFDLTRAAAGTVYEQAGIGPDALDLVELHDCFTSNEILSYEALGLTARGTAEKMIFDGDNTYGGRVVTNPSGGLLSKGHPLGATGLAQLAEIVWHLRGEAGERQVPNARLGLTHNIGMGGACVVTLVEREHA